MTWPWKKSRHKRDSNPGSSALEVDMLTTMSTRQSHTAEPAGWLFGCRTRQQQKRCLPGRNLLRLLYMLPHSGSGCPSNLLSQPLTADNGPTSPSINPLTPEYTPGAGIMEADDRQVTTVFTVQPSFHHRYPTNWESWSVAIVGEWRGEVWLHVRWRC